MISAGDFRKGLTFEIDGEPYVIVDFQHVKPGKGSAFVRTKYRNIITGVLREESFNPNAKFEPAHVENKNMQYLYNDGAQYIFMDNDTYEQVGLEKELVEDTIIYVKENDNVTLKFYKGKCFAIEAPNFVELKIVEAEPGIKGNTASNVTKKAVTETGATINVPLFVEEGDVIKIDTRTGEYLSRV